MEDFWSPGVVELGVDGCILIILMGKRVDLLARFRGMTLQKIRKYSSPHEASQPTRRITTLRHSTRISMNSPKIKFPLISQSARKDLYLIRHL